MPRKKNELKTKGHSEKKVIQKKEPLQLVEQATAIVAETPPQKPGDGSSRSGNKDSTQRQLQYDNEQEDDAVKKLIRPFEDNLTLSTQQPLSGTSSPETQRNPEESDERSVGRAIRKEAEDLGYSKPLQEAFVANNGEQQDEEFPKELLNPSCIFISPSSDFINVNCYTYCLVDSTSYESCGTDDFRAFLKSIRYIGEGILGRCCNHSFETQTMALIMQCVLGENLLEWAFSSSVLCHPSPKLCQYATEVEQRDPWGIAETYCSERTPELFTATGVMMWE